MPIINLHSKNPLADGRQSDRALAVRRGVQALLTELGAVHVPELTLASGRRADLTALFADGTIWIIEIKSSIEDMRVDCKWPDYFDYCDRLYFATLADVPQEIFPAECGFIRADAHGAALINHCGDRKLAPARRKAMTLRFAQFAARRLLAAELAGFDIPET